jgi:hypothetical protein
MFCREDSWTYRNFCATSFSASNPPVVLNDVAQKFL